MTWIRQEEILSPQGQETIGRQRLGLIGTGGIGSHFAEICAFVGFRRFDLVDFDINQEQNRNRSALQADLGRLKVECLRERLTAIDPEIEVAIHPVRIEKAPDAVSESTVIASCADNWQAWAFANQLAAERSQLLIDMGFGYADGRMFAHASLFKPGGACLLCGTLRAEAAPPTKASFLPTMMIAASLGAELLVAELTNYDRQDGNRPNLLLYDAIGRELIKLRRIPRDHCPVCSRGAGGAQ